MNDEVIGKLAKLVEQQVCAALIANNYARLEETDDNLLFDNLIISDAVAKKLNINVNNFYDDQEFLKELLSIFPSGKFSCSPAVLKARIRGFMRKTSITDITPDEMLTAARTWITRHETPYHGNIVNFIFKYEDKVYTSRLETVVEELRHDKLNTPNLTIAPTEKSSLDDL